MSRFIPPNPEFKSRIEDKLTRQHFMHLLGFEITDIEAGVVQGSLQLEEKHRQQFSILHGGVVSTVADIVAGFAAYTLAPADKDVVTAEIKISYFKPGRGQSIRARGEVIKPGRNVIFVEAEVWSNNDGEEKLIAKASTTMALIDRVDVS